MPVKLALEHPSQVTPSCAALLASTANKGLSVVVVALPGMAWRERAERGMLRGIPPTFLFIPFFSSPYVEIKNKNK